MNEINYFIFAVKPSWFVRNKIILIASSFGVTASENHIFPNLFFILKRSNELPTLFFPSYISLQTQMPQPNLT